MSNSMARRRPRRIAMVPRRDTLQRFDGHGLVTFPSQPSADAENLPSSNPPYSMSSHGHYGPFNNAEASMIS